MRIAPITESDILGQIRDRLRWDKWFVIRHQQGLGCHKGLSDLTAIKNGHTVYIEVKKPKGRQSDVQKDFQNDIESHGGVYVLAKSVDDIEFLCGGIKNKEVENYFLEQSAKQRDRIFSLHHPKFESKEEVDEWIKFNESLYNFAQKVKNGEIKKEDLIPDDDDDF
ncbi:MAG: hypothetical protein H6Q72_4779 [Firmicutes bacterium]|nr:hypothetical protein [Bacillota bacterium]